MDIKVQGLSYEILDKALNQARDGRLHILGKLVETIAEPRVQLKPQTPKIVVLNRKNNLDKKLNIFKTDSEVLIIDEKIINYNKNIVKQTLKYLKSKKIYSVIVEGGAQTLNTFLKENLWDEIKVFKSKKKIFCAPPAPPHGLFLKNVIY